MTRSSMSIRVLLIEDHPLALQGLAAALGRDPDIDVVGAASTGSEGLRLAAEMLPDVVVLDLLLPDTNGTQVVAELRRRAPKTRALIVSAREQTDDVLQALAAGAHRPTAGFRPWGPGGPAALPNAPRPGTFAKRSSRFTAGARSSARPSRRT